MNKPNYSIETIFLSHHKRAFNIALQFVQNVEDAEDITQEVFIEIHRSLANFREEASISTWIYRITVNKSLDFIKAKKRKKRAAFITQLFHPETGEQLHEISHFDHPGIQLEYKERSRILFQAIEKLKDSQKTAFVLSQIERLSQKETAQIMQLSEKAVESLVQRAKVNLRAILGELYHNRRI